MTVLQHIADYLGSLSGAIKRIRIVALVFGTGMIAVGQYFLGFQTGWQAEIAGEVFWVGLVVLLLTNLILVFVDKQSVETMQSLHAVEQEKAEVEDENVFLEKSYQVVVAWLTLTKLISELTDQALEATEIDEQGERRLYGAAVEFIAEYKSRLFGIEDDYLNISLYSHDAEADELSCVACYRSTPSDAKGPHRSWKPGEGHVGKAFELQNELVCSDARVPDVAAWIAAPPDKLKEDDSEKYVSLAAVPISVASDKPLGVVIMTSSEPCRFVNSSETEEDGLTESELQRAKTAVAALQDIAAQLAQLMYLVSVKKSS